MGKCSGARVNGGCYFRAGGGVGLMIGGWLITGVVLSEEILRFNMFGFTFGRDAPSEEF